VIRRRRLERTRRDLLTCRDGEPTLTAVCCRWGFPDVAVFSRAFREACGMLPTTYRAQGRGHGAAVNLLADHGDRC
jgi:AraC family transcriptional regulator, positive regulator of tynA and feaB